MNDHLTLVAVNPHHKFCQFFTCYIMADVMTAIQALQEYYPHLFPAGKCRIDRATDYIYLTYAED